MNSPQFEIGPISAPPRNSNFGWYFLAFVFLVLIAGQLAVYLGRDATGEQAVSAAESRIAKALQLDNPMGGFRWPLPGSLKESGKSVVRDEIERLRKNRSVEPGVVDYVEVVWSSAVGLPVPQENLRRMAKSDSERWRAAAKIFGGPKLSPQEAATLRGAFKSQSLTDRMVRCESYIRSGLAVPSTKPSNIGLIIAVLGLSGFVALGFLPRMKEAPGQPWLHLRSHPLGLVSPGEGASLALRAGALLIAMFGGQMVGATLGSMVGLRETFAGLLGFGFAGILCWLVLSMRIDGYSATLKGIGFRSNRLSSDIMWGAIAAVANWPLMFVTIILSNALFFWLPSPQHPVQQELISGPSIEKVAVILFTAVVLAPLFEETVFRGVLLPALVSKLKKPIVAIIVCGLLFAAIHPTGIPAWLTLAEIGAMAGFVTMVRGSLVPAIVMHGVHNGILLVVTLLTTSGGP